MNLTNTTTGWLKLIICLMIIPSLCFGQDIHFAHLSAVPTQVNPAYTGLMEGSARIGVDYRGQWNNFTKGFRTMALSADMKAWQGFNDIIGAGIFINSDIAGDLNFTTQQIGFNVSYLKGLNRQKSYLSFGLQSSIFLRRLDWNNAVAFDSEPLAPTQTGSYSNFIDFSAGMAFFHRFNRKISFFAGTSLFHLNRPSVNFYQKGLFNWNNADQLYLKWIGHTGAEVKFGRFNSIRPSFIYLLQGPHRQMKLGTFYRYKPDRGLHTDSQIAIHLGGYLRSFIAKKYSGVDAIIFAARFEYRQAIVTISYDTNISSLIRASKGVGGPEISYVQKFNWERRKKRKSKVDCPTFQY